MKIHLNLIIVFFLICASCSSKRSNLEQETSFFSVNSDSLILEGENHFKHLRQLTNGGDNAEAYWSFDDSQLVFQVTNPKWGDQCDQIYYFNWQTDNIMDNKPIMVSTGLGRTTCSYFLPGDSLILYASTHNGNKNCPPRPEPRSDGKYVWPIYSDFDIYVTDLNGNIVRQLTSEPGYDAEATVSPKGDKIVFTSIRTGDLELYTMDLDGTNVKKITFDLGYDGGAFFSPDGSKLIFRASRPETPGEISEYKQLLEEGLVKPTEMELFICNIDGSELRQLTDLGRANWCPFFHPSGNKVIFASNYTSERGFPFNLYLINTDGTGLEQVTKDGIFDAFPVFSNNGKYLVFSSNRNNGGTSDTNLFVSEWID
jgi:Tol biopolymer transport system component